MASLEQSLTITMPRPAILFTGDALDDPVYVHCVLWP